MGVTFEDVQKLFGFKTVKLNAEIEAEFLLNDSSQSLDKAIFLKNAIKNKVLKCEECNLRFSGGCTQKVPGEGSIFTPLMFVGEAPGFEEDRQGKPFVGKAGQLLSRILSKSEINREKVYITNVVKCRPPNNRTPFPKEISACRRILELEINIIKPSVIIALGSVALRFFKEKTSIMQERGNWIIYKGIWVLPTFHPAYLLRKKGQALIKAKWQVWGDFQKAIQKCKEIKPDYDFK